jgi:hypothetical protein
MSCYAPGPWRAVGASIKAVSHGIWFTVARAETRKFTGEGTLANARLIAASPELLEACLEALHFIDSRSDDKDDGEIFILKALRDAIAKAAP